MFDDVASNAVGANLLDGGEDAARMRPGEIINRSEIVFALKVLGVVCNRIVIFGFWIRPYDSGRLLENFLFRKWLAVRVFTFHFIVIQLLIVIIGNELAVCITGVVQLVLIFPEHWAHRNMPKAKPGIFFDKSC